MCSHLLLVTSPIRAATHGENRGVKKCCYGYTLDGKPFGRKRKNACQSLNTLLAELVASVRTQKQELSGTLTQMGDEGDGVRVPGRNSDEGFSARLREALGGKSGTWLAKQIDASASTVNDWLRGDSEPVLSRLVLCARVLGVSVEWLASGEEAQLSEVTKPRAARSDIDKHLMSRALEGVRRTYENRKVRAPTIVEVEAAWEIYERVVAVAETEEERRGALRMALSQLDREIAEPPREKPSGKQSA